MCRRHLTERGKNLIPDRMPVPIVDPFELIEIKHDEGHRLARKARPHQQSFALLEESAAVRDAGERIGQRCPLITCSNSILNKAPE